MKVATKNVQAVRLSKALFTEDEAKAWMDERGLFSVPVEKKGCWEFVQQVCEPDVRTVKLVKGIDAVLVKGAEVDVAPTVTEIGEDDVPEVVVKAEGTDEKPKENPAAKPGEEKPVTAGMKTYTDLIGHHRKGMEHCKGGMDYCKAAADLNDHPGVKKSLAKQSGHYEKGMAHFQKAHDEATGDAGEHFPDTDFEKLLTPPEEPKPKAVEPAVVVPVVEKAVEAPKFVGISDAAMEEIRKELADARNAAKKNDTSLGQFNRWLTPAK